MTFIAFCLVVAAVIFGGNGYEAHNNIDRVANYAMAAVCVVIVAFLTWSV